MREVTISLVGFIVVPCVASMVWMHAAELQRVESPLAADFLGSEGLRSWTLGTLDQRLSWEDWRGYIRLTLDDSLGSVALGLIGIVGLIGITKEKGWQCLGAMLLFLVPPAIFTNVHFTHSFAHNYYTYANALLLLLALGLALQGLADHREVKLRVAGYGMLLLVVAIQFHSYSELWAVHTDATDDVDAQYLEVADMVRMHTTSDQVSVVYGCSFNSIIPYYSQRRAVMVRSRSSAEAEEQALEKLVDAKYAIGSVVFCNQSGNRGERLHRISDISHRGPFHKVFINDLCEVYRIGGPPDWIATSRLPIHPSRSEEAPDTPVG
jgi:hypothetical protein